MSYPTMQAVTSYQGGSRATVTVEHDIHQSYSRSVDPRAMREMRQRSRGLAWELFDADYGHDTDGHRTNSTFLFRLASTPT